MKHVALQYVARRTARVLFTVLFMSWSNSFVFFGVSIKNEMCSMNFIHFVWGIIHFVLIIDFLHLVQVTGCGEFEVS